MNLSSRHLVYAVVGDHDEPFEVEVAVEDREILKCLSIFIAKSSRDALGKSPEECVKNWLRARQEYVPDTDLKMWREIVTLPGFSAIETAWQERRKRYRGNSRAKKQATQR